MVFYRHFVDASVAAAAAAVGRVEWRARVCVFFHFSKTHFKCGDDDVDVDEEVLLLFLIRN